MGGNDENHFSLAKPGHHQAHDLCPHIYHDQRIEQGDPDQLDKIFDPYFSTKKDGTGLGLAICHSIISKHGGYIEVTSKVGLGTTFSIFLVASEKDLSLDPTTASIAEKPNEQGRGRILIMDDEEPVRNVLKGMLNYDGYEVVQASDGEEALALYKQMAEDAAIDLIIMDMTIPGGMGGKETAKKILEINPTAKLIVSSGYSNDPVMANCREFGFRAAVSKPFAMQALLAAVRDVLRC